MQILYPSIAVFQLTIIGASLWLAGPSLLVR